MKKLLMMFFALLTVMVGNAAGRKINIMDLPPFERAVIIIKKFETLHRPKDYPYVGYGHRVLPGEPTGEACSSPRNKLTPCCVKTCENSCHSTRHTAKMPCC